MISVEQIKAARAILEWTQEDLAAKCALSKAGINNIERRIVLPRMETLQVIQSTFETAGIEFVDGPGVILKGEKLEIKKFEGKESLIRLHEDVLETLKRTGGELLISGVDEERLFQDINKNKLLVILAKIRKMGIKSRLLSLEGDKNFVEPKECYRWVSKEIFSQVPFAVYGDKYAILSWNAPRRAVIIENKAIAESYRQQFNHTWKTAKTPRV